MSEITRSSIRTIRETYKDLLDYYDGNIGKKSEITGTMITKRLINTIRRRYEQLGGHLFKKGDK